MLVCNPPETDHIYNIRSLIHEGTHSSNFANVGEKLSFVEKWTGINDVSEAYAYLLEGLTQNKHWLKNVAGLSGEKADFYIKPGALQSIHSSGQEKYLHDIELKLSEDGVNSDNYREFTDKIVEDARENLVYSSSVTVWGEKAGAYSVIPHLDGHILSAQLEEVLRKFGTKKNNFDDWYENPEAGKFLKELWFKGIQLPHELSKMLGYKPLDTKPLINKLKRDIGEPITQ